MRKHETKKSISFRIEPGILEKLGKAAKEDHTTLNSFVNQVLSDHAYWDRSAKTAGWILMKQEIVRSMLDSLSQNEIRKIALGSAKEVMKDTLLAMTGKYDLETWLAVTRYRSTRSGFHYQQTSRDNKVSIIIKHGLGLKWSMFHKWYYLQMIKDLGRSATCDYTDKTIVINIR